jgi:hypothetical protein
MRAKAFIYVTGKNRRLYFLALERPYRLAVRTPPFHGGGTGSIPVRVAIFFNCFLNARRRTTLQRFKLTFTALSGSCELSANEIKHPIDRKEFMKRVTLATVIVAVATASVFAQGTVNFHGDTAHVYRTNGTPVGVGVFAQLLGAPGSNAPESNLLPAINPPMTFRTGAAAGEVGPFIATFNNIAPDAPFGSFEMVAWDNSTGLYPTWTEPQWPE